MNNKLSKKHEKAAYTANILTKMSQILRADGKDRLAEACVKVAIALHAQSAEYENQEEPHPFDDVEQLFSDVGFGRSVKPVQSFHKEPAYNGSKRGSFGKNY